MWLWGGGGHHFQPPRELSGSFDPQLICNDTYLLCLLSSGQNNDIIIQLLHGDASIGVLAAHLLAKKENEKKILDSRI